MTELQKCELAKSKGFTYCPLSGKVIGERGREIRGRDRDGYIVCQLIHSDKKYEVKSHRLAWYLHYGKLPSNNIDHKDGVRTNNKIDNLRDVTQQQNTFNISKAKGYTWRKKMNKFESSIKLDGKSIYLGRFDNENEARNAYLAAKEKYHVIPSV